MAEGEIGLFGDSRSSNVDLHFCSFGKTSCLDSLGRRNVFFPDFS
jgi:hypothetical protein